MRWRQATPAIMVETAHRMNTATLVAALLDTQDKTVKPTLMIVMVLHVKIAEPVQMGLIPIPVHVLWDTVVTSVRPTLTTAPMILVEIGKSVLMESILTHVSVWITLREAAVS